MTARPGPPWVPLTARPRPPRRARRAPSLPRRRRRKLRRPRKKNRNRNRKKSSSPRRTARSSSRRRRRRRRRSATRRRPRRARTPPSRRRSGWEKTRRSSRNLRCEPPPPGRGPRVAGLPETGVELDIQPEARPGRVEFLRVRSLRTQQRAESQCQVIPRAGPCVGRLGFLWLIDIESVSSRFSAGSNASTESLILAQDERWRRA